MTSTPAYAIHTRADPRWPAHGYVAVELDGGACVGFARSSVFAVDGVALAQRMAEAIEAAWHGEREAHVAHSLRSCMAAAHRTLAAIAAQPAFAQTEATWDYGGSLALAAPTTDGVHWIAVGDVAVYSRQDRGSVRLKLPDTLGAELRHTGQTTHPFDNVQLRYLGGADEFAVPTAGLLRQGALCFAAEGLDTEACVEAALADVSSELGERTGHLQGCLVVLRTSCG